MTEREIWEKFLAIAYKESKQFKIFIWIIGLILGTFWVILALAALKIL